MRGRSTPQGRGSGPLAVCGAGLLVLLAMAVAALPHASAANPHQGVSGTVHIRGIAYTFDNQRPIAGATIKVVEVPGVSATSQSDGSYDLVVPDGTKVTPYMDAAGHHRIYAQTFVTQGRDLERVNFQAPTQPIYLALAALLGVELDANRDPARCAVVSTFVNVDARELSFPDFVAFGAHGVAGATASTAPALPAPVYFNEFVIPDRSRTESSIDGGVIWTEVPEGVYQVRGHHPTKRFADFVASCRPGRLVNANPPQGLYQLRPDESVDRDVAADLSSAELKRTGSRGDALRLHIRADEYVAAGAELLQGGRRLFEKVAGEGIGAFAPGHRILSFPIAPAVPSGTLELRTTLEDGAGNRETDVRQVRLPQAEKGARNP